MNESNHLGRQVIVNKRVECPKHKIKLRRFFIDEAQKAEEFSPGVTRLVALGLSQSDRFYILRYVSRLGPE